MTTSLMKMAKTGRISKPLSDLEQKHLATLRNQVQLGESVLAELWGIEETASEKIKKALDPIQAQLRALELKASGMKKLSLVPLTWRNAKGLPVLVPFCEWSRVFGINTDGNIVGYSRENAALAKLGLRVLHQQEQPYSVGKHEGFVISSAVHGESHTLVELTYPEKIHQCYSDVRVRESITCDFDGIVPLSTKRKMKSVAHLFSSMYIIAEVESWEISLPDIDPLAVGWDGEALWLIDVFDATPAEEAMASFLLPGG